MAYQPEPHPKSSLDSPGRSSTKAKGGDVQTLVPVNGVIFGGERTGEGSLRLLGAGEAYARWRRGGRRGRKRKKEVREVGERAD